MRAGRVALAAVAAFALVAGVRRINDPDYFTHLALGRAMAAAGSPFVAEPSLDVAPGPAPDGALARLAEGWLSSSGWPFQVALHGLRAALGDGAVSLAVAACAALAALLLARPLAREERPARAALGALLAVAALFVARGRIAPRPEVVGAVLLGVSLEAALAFGRRPSAWPLARLAIALAAWVPVHVTWALGAGLAGVALAARPRLDWWRARPLPVRLAAVAAAALAALGAARFAWRVAGWLAPGGLLARISEMQPTWRFPALLAQLLLLAAAAAALAWGAREGRAQRLALVAAATLLGTLVVRNLGFAALALVPAALAGLDGWTPRPLPGARAAPVACAAAGVALLGLALRDRDPPPGLGVDWRWFPRDAAEWVRTAPVGSPVFNSLDLGGYLGWAWAGEPRTFVDGRVHDAAVLEDHDAIVHGNPEGPLARRGIRTAVLQPMYSSGRLLQAVPWFLQSPGWRLVRATDALVFAAEPLPPGVAPLPSAEAWRAVLARADVLADQADAPRHLDFTRALALLQLGDARAAAEAWARGRREHPALAREYRRLGAALERGPR